MTLTGHMLIGQHIVAGNREAIRGINPATNATLEPAYAGGSAEHVEQACALAWAAFDAYRETPLNVRADFLESIAVAIEALGDELIDRAMAETGLPRFHGGGFKRLLWTGDQLEMTAREARISGFDRLRFRALQPVTH